MVREKYGVRLTPEQRNQLEHLVRAGKSTARVTTRARILLKTDAAWSAPQAAQALDVVEGTVFRIKRRFAEEGLAGALPDRVQANRYRKLEDRGEAHPVSSTGQALYAEPDDPKRPVVCFDETSTQLLAQTRPPLPAQPGLPQRQDFAQQLRWLVAEAYPAVAVVRLVLDNPVSSTGQALNTHRLASLYETFPAAEARRIAKRLEFHYPPKHGSWLNPVLSLPKGWRKSSSAYYPAPA